MTTNLSAVCGQACETIGPIGRLARLGVGLVFIAAALLWRDPSWRDAVLGLVIAPAVVVVLAAWRARRSPGPLRATGPIAYAVNVAVGLVALTQPATAGAAFLFYGGSMLVAAGRANGGCEVTAVSNLVLGRDDQVGCAAFAPVDLAEQALARRSSIRSAAAE